MPFDISILSVKDIIDILLVAFLLYKTYKLMKSSGSINVFTGILVFIVIWVIVSQVLQMRLLGSIFDKLVSVGVIARKSFRMKYVTSCSRLVHATAQAVCFAFLREVRRTTTAKRPSCLLSWLAST